MLLLLAFLFSVGNGVTFFTNPMLRLFLDKFGREEIGLGAASSPMQNSKRDSLLMVSGRSGNNLSKWIVIEKVTNPQFHPCDMYCTVHVFHLSWQKGHLAYLFPVKKKVATLYQFLLFITFGREEGEE
jgi:hypothetical protein